MWWIKKVGIEETVKARGRTRKRRKCKGMNE